MVLSYIAIMSDVHGNLQALEAVIDDMEQYDVEWLVLLGDLIDYGQQSNEVIQCLQERIACHVLCNLWGNHEKSIFSGEYGRFSSQRGKDCARYTASVLNSSAVKYLETCCVRTCAKEFEIGSKKVLAVHGSLEEPAWTGITADDLHGDYQAYDVVLSGHTHCSHCFTRFYDSRDEKYRNQKVVWFINPGSVGQPRNHNPNAQYALLETSAWSVILRSVPYDVSGAMEMFHGQVDDFYRSSL